MKAAKLKLNPKSRRLVKNRKTSSHKYNLKQSVKPEVKINKYDWGVFDEK